MSEQDEKGFIKGEIVFIIFENKKIVLKCHFTNLQKGVFYIFHGALTIPSRFRMQYDVSAYKTYVPATKDALIAYLSSDIFPGVVKKTAEAIVDHMGENAIE